MACATESTLRDLMGVKADEAALRLLNSAVHALGNNGNVYLPPDNIDLCRDCPRDAVEAMLAGQMTATHVMMTGLANKVMDAPNQNLREGYGPSVTRLSRTYLAQMNALKKCRSKAQQTIRVERVTVESGGLPHAKRTRGPTMRCACKTHWHSVQKSRRARLERLSDALCRRWLQVRAATSQLSARVTQEGFA